ncbi:OmpA family protein [Oceaniglobus trochenteri]|uniref:OmpA family protein n=1 Tax=Oceaniglobus trochenteri TaxID=2763260 RepID=UPI001CFFC708|nr:OmpA family protein [Oceaniglobus trochenteri]
MRSAPFIPAFFAFGLAAIIAVFSASFAVSKIEKTSVADVTTAMRDQGHDWVSVSADGLQLELAGTAPDEATRFRAITVANGIVDAARVIDQMEVAAAAVIEAPRFSVEILRNAGGISLIGLIPAATDRTALLEKVRKIKDAGEVSDLLEIADYTPPEGWNTALDFGLMALAKLPRSKISIAADEVLVDAISDSRDAKRRLESDLSRAAPEGLRLAMTIAAPRPVITPFTLRFLIDGDGARFDACSAATEKGRDRILAAARTAGLEGQASCTIGLGVPSPEWPQAAVAAIDALADLGGGSVTLSDADITLVGQADTKQADFDRRVGELEGALPLGFSLFAVLPEPVVIDGTGDGAGAPEFVATRNEEGAVQLRGRIGAERARKAMGSFARARFGMEAVTDATRSDDSLPEGWLPRVLAALDSLALLHEGTVVVQPDVVDVTGRTGNPDARAEVSRILSDQLGSAENFTLKITYDKKLDPVLGLPTPEECVEQINQVLAVRKITFAPGSAEIDADARDTVERIAELLRTCDDVQMEIGGYTDSQGREIMNQQLSQSRAEAVLTALAARRVATANLVAIGYGEERPIATNETEEGREANRRIEFRLIVPEEDAEADRNLDEDPPEAEEGEIITGGAGTENEQN